MYRFYFLLSFLLISIYTFSQVTIVIESIPENTPEEDFIFIAGGFNAWNPGDENYKLIKNSNDEWQIELDAEVEGTQIEFKFTRGSWETVEKDENGQEMSNRQFIYGNGESVSFSISTWADGGSGGGSSTASDNVSILSEDFFMPPLNRNRRIWLYLPPDYHISDKNYPVLYMHDGQNIFDSFTSFSGEWEVDETLDNLAEEGINVPIVIGIDNGGGHRLDEYSAWVNTQYGGGEGRDYMQFITETLKPYVDENYRTLSDKAHTGMVGSSLGAFISHFGAFQHADVFGKLASFSPSFWYSDSVWAFTELNAQSNDTKVYQIVGSEEGGTMLENMEQMHDDLISYGYDEQSLKSKVVDGAGHNEALWRGEFEDAYLWLFSEFANGTDALEVYTNIELHPNPVKNEFHLTLNNIDSLVIYSADGELVMRISDHPSSNFNVEHLPPGVYFVLIHSGNHNYSSKMIKL